MTSIQGHVNAAILAVQQDQDARQHAVAVAWKLEDGQVATDLHAAEELLQTLHDSLLPDGGGGMQPQTECGRAVLGNVMAECLENVLLLANVSAVCNGLAQSLVIHYACCTPREAGILLLASLGHQSGCV